jgi:hypothetical protein
LPFLFYQTREKISLDVFYDAFCYGHPATSLDGVKHELKSIPGGVPSMVILPGVQQYFRKYAAMNQQPNPEIILREQIMAIQIQKSSMESACFVGFLGIILMIIDRDVVFSTGTNSVLLRVFNMLLSFLLCYYVWCYHDGAHRLEVTERPFLHDPDNPGSWSASRTSMFITEIVICIIHEPPGLNILPDTTITDVTCVILLIIVFSFDFMSWLGFLVTQTHISQTVGMTITRETYIKRFAHWSASHAFASDLTHRLCDFSLSLFLSLNSTYCRSFFIGNFIGVDKTITPTILNPWFGFMFLRMYLAVRVLFSHTFGTGPIVLSRWVKFDLNVTFLVRVLMDSSALNTVGMATFSVFMITAYLMFECDRVFGGQFNSLQGTMWWSFATITTLGYGDFYATTMCSRVVVIGGGVVGIIVLSGVFSALTGMLAISPTDQRLFDFTDLYEAKQAKCVQYRLTAVRVFSTFVVL